MRSLSYSSRYYTVSEIKTRLRKIYEQELEPHNDIVEFFPLTIVQYYKSPIFKERLELSHLSFKEIVKPFKCIGYHARNNNIVIFIRKKKIKNMYDLPMFIKTLYHELKHYKQHMMSKNSKDVNLDKVRYDMEAFIMQNDYEHYETNYYGYYFEMEAELYALNKSLKYLQENGLLSDNLRWQYEKEKEVILFIMCNFNIQIYLKKIHEIMQTDFIEIQSWLFIFYNKDGTFKKIEEILDLINLYDVGEDVFNIFFTSEAFLASADFSSLTSEQQNVISKALQSSYELEIERYKNNFNFLKKGIIIQKMLIRANSLIAKRLIQYSKKIEELKNINLSDINMETKDLKRQR